MTDGAFLSFGGVRASVGSLVMPYTGAWAADLEFPDTTTLPTTGELVVGNLSLTGTVYRSAAFAGSRMTRIVGGHGGWRESVPAHAYSLPSGVLLSLVLRDTARVVGEVVHVPTGADHILGNYYIREAAPAQRVLAQLVGSGWYIDTDGTTVIASRPTDNIGSYFLVNAYQGALGQFTISTEDYAAWLPGATFTNELVPDVQTVGMVRLETSNDGLLRHTVLATGPDGITDRMLQPIRDVIRNELPRLTYLGCYQYTVIGSAGDTVSCAPLNPAIGLPSIVRIPVRSGVAGMRSIPRTGTRLAVGFLDSDPTLPFVVGGMDLPGSSAPVVCYGDVVALSVTGSGTITGPASFLRRVEAETL